jgi:hypothetical protein
VQLPFYEYDSLTVLWGGEPVGIFVSEHEGVWGWLEDDGRQLAIQLEIVAEAVGADFHDRASSPCHFSALEIRHRFVSGYELAGNTWFATSSAPTRVHIETDRALVVEVDRVRRRIRRPLTFDSREPHAISILERNGIMGGPFIAAGGAILDANPARGRIGWEHTYLYPFLFYSAALETDFTREFTFVPAVEITHGGGLGALMIPRAGLGVGVPMQFLPDPRPGLRTQVSLSWFVFSFLTTFDWLPVLPPTGAGSERPQMFKLAFLGQFSF